MKRLIFVLSLGLIIGMANTNKADAQVHVSINIDLQPAWGPSGYNYAEFYYIPEINIYYDVVNQLFYYPNRGRWISSVFLPVAYSYYDFYSLYKVVLNGVHHPWKYNRRHVNTYSPYRYNYVQVPIFYMKEPRYRHARDNYHGWVEPRYMPKNNGRPNGRDFSMNTRNGRVSNEMRPANTNDRREVNSNHSSSRRNEATVNRHNSNNNNNNSRNNSKASTRENDRDKGRSRNITDDNKQSSSVTGSRIGNTRSSVSADNNNSSVSRRNSNSRSSEDRSSRSAKENRSERSESNRSSRR